MDKKTLPIALCLGALCALGPLGTDMYLSAMPQMSADLGAPAASIQMSVMSFFLGFTIGQLFYGPISDRTGRKPMVYLALAIFLIASIGCTFATSADQLLVWRFAQGIGGSIGMVISTAVVRDLYTGVMAAKLMSLVVLVLGMAPIIAPLIGSLILEFAEWRYIFALLAAFSLAAAAMIYSRLPETRTPDLRAGSNPAHALKHYARLLVSGSFVPFAGTLALTQGGFFAYITGSSFVMINIYGLSPLVYSIIFGVNAVGLGIGTQVAASQMKRFGAKTIVKTATLVYASAAVLLLALEMSGLSGLWQVCLLLFLIISALGAIMPSCNLLSMEAHGAIAGTAAALMGGLGFGAGALGSFLIGIFEDGSAIPMVAIIAGFALLAALVALTSFDRQAVLATEQP
ncbi:multidrug effflux MFS transporter [Rhizobium sp. CG5]|uniref:multidrug effflux MFS transporter n=1 Tax=Rhizobium sp. CG5 TaxID=2726076 RepID=UPI0020346D7B|nr:multidrug effflux MFS transporter [Rhizobium sp. CG5]MCM2473246.1 multidrug effflux MFS transporter [Rhizobium sp. CG5]